MKLAITLSGNTFQVDGDVTVSEVTSLFRQWLNAQQDVDPTKPDLESLTETLETNTAQLASAVEAASPAILTRSSP